MSVCRICNSNTLREHTFMEMMFGTKELFTYLECNICGCIQISEYPVDIERHYPIDYYSFANSVSDLNIFEHKAFKTILRKNVIKYDQLYLSGLLGKVFGKRFRPNFSRFQYLPLVCNNIDKSILDFGCGNGKHLIDLYKIGFRKLTGYDKYILNPFNISGKISVMNGDVSNLKDKYDIITMHHVFEHMPNQIIAIKNIANLLNKNGRIVIRIPIKNKAWELYGSNWAQIDAPRHFYLHTIASMERLVNSAELKIEKIEFDSGHFQFWGSEQYSQDISLFRDERSFKYNKNLFTSDQISSWKNLALAYNKQGLGDQAIFVIRN